MAAPYLVPGLKLVQIQNRKFIGSKQSLLDFIAGVVAERAPAARSMADLFCGSGVVAHHFAAQGMQVVASDLLYHNYISARCFLAGRPGQVDWRRLTGLLHRLDGLAPQQGYCYREYGGSYFTLQNAGRIDAIRDEIQRLQEQGRINDQEFAILLTSLIYGADKVANTCGQYDAYLKHLGAEPYAADGTHRVDAMVYRRLELGVPQVLEQSGALVVCADADDLAELEIDLLYLDPPYNSRQYVDNYHVLENIARWEKPELFGKTRKFDRQHLKSPYSTRRFARERLEGLIERARARHILLSYNNEGIVPDGAIMEAMGRRGEVEVFTRTYAVFGNGAGRSRRRPVLERLFYCRVTRPPATG